MFSPRFGENHRPMITALLHMLRLLPFLCGGHRHLALENVALRQQLVVYQCALSGLSVRSGARRPSSSRCHSVS
jgi:hypothetical protein